MKGRVLNRKFELKCFFWPIDAGSALGSFSGRPDLAFDVRTAHKCRLALCMQKAMRQLDN